MSKESRASSSCWPCSEADLAWSCCQRHLQASALLCKNARHWLQLFPGSKAVDSIQSVSQSGWLHIKRNSSKRKKVGSVQHLFFPASRFMYLKLPYLLNSTSELLSGVFSDAPSVVIMPSIADFRFRIINVKPLLRLSKI